MASLVKLRKIVNPLVSKNPGLLYNVVRSKVHTNDDWKPGPYPKTEEERKKAAEKYGLSPEEYEPYPDDGDGHGDYPKLPMIGVAARDPFYPWDNPTHKRNFNEPMHVMADVMGPDRCDVGVKPIVTGKQAYLSFFGLIGCLTLAVYLAEPWNMHHAVMEKQMPKPGVVHYTFEPAR